jgi:hypothetical protein
MPNFSRLTFADHDLISSPVCMNDWELLARNVGGAFRQTKKARRRKLLTWIGTLKFISGWLKQRREANIEVGMLTNW